MKGQIKVHLFVASDRPDTDIALRLTEVYPDGRSIALGQIIQRLRFRSGYTMADEELMQPGQVYEIAMTFDQLANTFKAGNQIRLIITSSNYPWFNRNMNTGDEMYPNDNLDTLVNPEIAQNTIYLQGTHPSRMIVPVVQSTSATEGLEGESFAVFPIPVDDCLVLKNAPIGSRARIVDTTGKAIQYTIVNEPEESIPTQYLPSGVYFLQIDSDSSPVSRKFIVLHR